MDFLPLKKAPATYDVGVELIVYAKQTLTIIGYLGLCRAYVWMNHLSEGMLRIRRSIYGKLGR